jgi:PKD domain
MPRAVVVIALALGLSTMAAGIARAAGPDARVSGAFSMRARVTVAVNVRGEHAGELLTRRWVITPRSCRGDVCRSLVLERQRGGHRYSRLTLHRVGAGRYAGAGSFFVGLSCEGRVYVHGSRAPYRIALRIVAATTVGGVRFARRIAATYVNPSRSDATQCPLGPSHDAARYTGQASSPLPVAPTAAFAVLVNPANGSALFGDESSPGSDHSPLVRWRWDFGDPQSGAADSAISPDPWHQFSAPGLYQVTLTATDGEGLSATTVRPVTVPSPPVP